VNPRRKSGVSTTLENEATLNERSALVSNLAATPLGDQPPWSVAEAWTWPSRRLLAHLERPSQDMLASNIWRSTPVVVISVTLILLPARNKFRLCQSSGRAAIPLPDFEDPPIVESPAAAPAGSEGIGAGLHRSPPSRCQ
jgi:hypothetical protein